MVTINLLYWAMLLFAAVMWFIPVAATVTFLLGVWAGWMGRAHPRFSPYKVTRAICNEYRWYYTGFLMALALAGSWWSLSWW